MAEPKTQETTASVADHLATIADDTRRADAHTVAAMMGEATGAEPRIWGANLVGFGRYRYRYASGRDGEWPVISFTARKNDLTLYLMPGTEAFPDLMARLGKYKTGKSCLHLRRLADVDVTVLRELIQRAVDGMAAQRVDR